MDQFAEGAFVGSEAARGVEAAQSGAAERAPARSVERELILERRAAAGAEILRRQRLGRAQAGRADGNARIAA